MDVAGLDLSVELTDFANWAQTLETNDVITFTPQNEEDISDIVDVSSNYNLGVRTIGASHSDARLYPDEGQVAIDLTQFHNDENETIFSTIGPVSAYSYTVLYKMLGVVGDRGYIL